MIMNWSIRTSFFLLGCSLGMLLPVSAFAATTLFFDAPARVQPSTDVPIVLRAHIERPINAMHLVVRYDPATIVVTGIDTHDSIIRQWLSIPDYSASGGLVFTGIMPGGVDMVLADSAPIARLMVRFLRPGQARFSITDPVVYLHQPDAQHDEVIVQSHTMYVSSDAPEISILPPSHTSPIDADIRLIRELALGPEWFLAFDIQTEQGRPPIRVRERFLGLSGTWREAQNPYRLSDQRLMSILEVGIASGSEVHVVKTIVPGRLQALMLGLMVMGIAGILFLRT
jgi:hypothetical protein